jgi:hypothetical protein
MQLPQHQALLVSVHGRRGSEDVVVSQLWHVPSSATIALATVAHPVAEAMGDKERLRQLGIELAAPLLQAAIALISVHPNIATRQPTEAAVTKSLLARTPAVTTLGKKIAQLQQVGRDGSLAGGCQRRRRCERLRAFTFGHVRQLDKLLVCLSLPRPAAPGARRPPTRRVRRSAPSGTGEDP